MTDYILLEIATNTNKNNEDFVKKHVGFDENDKITFSNPTDIHEIWALIGLFYLHWAMNQNLHSFILPRFFLWHICCNYELYEILFSVSDGTIWW